MKSMKQIESADDFVWESSVARMGSDLHRFDSIVVIFLWYLIKQRKRKLIEGPGVDYSIYVTNECIRAVDEKQPGPYLVTLHHEHVT